MLRFALCALAFVLVALTPGEAFAQLPTTSFVFDSNTCANPVTNITSKPGTQCRQAENFEIYVRDNLTGTVTQVTNNPDYDSWWPKLSPDRTMILFHRTDAGLKERDGFQRTSLWVMPVTGGAGWPKMLMSGSKGITAGVAPGNFGFEMQAHAEWSPNGQKIALLLGEDGWANPTDGRALQIATATYTGGASPSISAPQRVTFGNSTGEPRPGTVLDPAWKDNNTILFIGCVKGTPLPPPFPIVFCDPNQNPSELFTTPDSATYSAGTEVRVTNHGTAPTADMRRNFDPYYNTNSTQIAWLREVNCGRWSIQHSGSAPLSSKAEVIDDGATNSKPGWSGTNSMYFHRWANSIQSIAYTVNFFGGYSGWLDSGPFSELCQTEAPNSTSTRTGGTVVAPPIGLETTALLMASSRCAPGSACTTAKPWRIYKRNGGAITNPTNGWPLAVGGVAIGGDAFSPRISPDRSRILFFRTDGGLRGNPHAQELWVMDADGTDAKMLLASGDAAAPATVNAFSWKTMGDANWSPDGTQIVISAANATQLGEAQIYTMTFQTVGTCAAVGTSRPAPCVDSPVRRSFASNVSNAERDGNNIQPSWSTDTAAGTKLIFIGCARTGSSCSHATQRRNEIVTVSATATTGAASSDTVLTNTGTTEVAYQSPYYSPNNTNIIAARTVTCSSTSVVMMPAAGGTVTELFANAIHLDPQWLHDSTGIIFGLIADETRASIYSIAPNAVSPGTPDDGTPIPPTALTTGTPCASEFPSTGY